MGDKRAEQAVLDAAWLRFRAELDDRIVARFGPALDASDGSDADPEILADLALQRALTNC